MALTTQPHTGSAILQIIYPGQISVYSSQKGEPIVIRTSKYRDDPMNSNFSTGPPGAGYYYLKS